MRKSHKIKLVHGIKKMEAVGKLAGDVAFLAKPFTLAGLASKVRKFLDTAGNN